MLPRLLPLLLLGVVVRGEIVLHERVEPLSRSSAGPLVRAGDGAIWGVDAAGVRVSRDEVRSWESRAIFDAARFQSRPERALLRTREGVILHAFLNQKEYSFKWDDAKGGPQEGCRLPVYVVRSADDGRSWAAPVLVQDGWCGALQAWTTDGCHPNRDGHADLATRMTTVIEPLIRTLSPSL